MKRETEQFKHDYLPLQPAMQRMAERLLGNEDEAADVVQDCFVALWTDRERLSRVVNCEAWAITLVKRRAIDALRRRHYHEPLDERLLSTDDDDSAAHDERLRLALRLIDRLPERQAQAVRLRHRDACSTQEIASALAISEGNVYTLLSRAYSNLKQMILNYEER